MTLGTDAVTLERLRSWGQARLDVALQATSAEEWKRLWPAAAHSFAMRWGTCWTFAPCYHVADFAAEIGFWLDVLGFDSNAIAGDFCMVMDPEKKLTFSVRPASEERPATPADALTLEFMVEGIRELCDELASRGVAFEQSPEPYGASNSPMYTAMLRTPAGLRVWLWGLVDVASASAATSD